MVNWNKAAVSKTLKSIVSGLNFIYGGFSFYDRTTTEEKKPPRLPLSKMYHKNKLSTLKILNHYTKKNIK
jgi:hypothetical protein